MGNIRPYDVFSASLSYYNVFPKRTTRMVWRKENMQKNQRNKKSKKFQENFNFFMNSIIYSIFNNPLHNKYFDNFPIVRCAIWEILPQFKKLHCIRIPLSSIRLRILKVNMLHKRSWTLISNFCKTKEPTRFQISAQICSAIWLSWRRRTVRL